MVDNNEKHFSSGIFYLRKNVNLAERVGFEPTCRFTGNSISSRARCVHFDTAPCIFKPGYRLKHRYFVVLLWKQIAENPI